MLTTTPSVLSQVAAIAAQAHVVDGALEVACVIALDQDIAAITGYTKVTLEQLYQVVKPHGQVLRGDRCLHPRTHADNRGHGGKTWQI
jgi:hypothetical protein